MLHSSVNQPEQVNKFMLLTQHRLWQVWGEYEWKVLFYPLCPSVVWKGLIYDSSLTLVEAMCLCVYLYTECVYHTFFCDAKDPREWTCHHQTGHQNRIYCKWPAIDIQPQKIRKYLSVLHFYLMLSQSHTDKRVVLTCWYSLPPSGSVLNYIILLSAIQFMCGQRQCKHLDISADS